MTNRQEKIWYRKMVKLEQSLLDYYARRNDKPDGSFCMSAFKSGYYLARQRARKKTK